MDDGDRGPQALGERFRGGWIDVAVDHAALLTARACDEVGSAERAGDRDQELVTVRVVDVLVMSTTEIAKSGR